MTSSNWYFRVNWNDSPSAPDRAASWASPDIITVGVEELDPNKVAQQIGGTYSTPGSDPTLNVVPNTTNYIYLRGFNRSSQALGTVQFKLIAMPLNAGIPDPSRWVRCLPVSGAIPSDNQVLEIHNIQPGVYAVPVPFRWTSSPDVQQIHHCYFALSAVTSEGEVLATDQQIYQGMGGWIQSHWNCAQRNIGWSNVDPNLGVQILLQSFVNTPLAMNPAWVRVKCEGCAIGWDVGFESEENDNSSTPQRIVLPRTKITSTGICCWMVGGVFNAGWNSKVNFFIWRNGIAAPPGTPSITLDLVTLTTTSNSPATLSDMTDDPNRVVAFKPAMASHTTAHGQCTFLLR